ncbi:MAG: AEC family transporter [Clostridiales bacterium]|nr:AEC family transporter [Clostridiales bacterium]
MFRENILIAGEQVLILYLMVIIGAISDRAGVFTEKTAKKCTDLLFYVVTPAKIIESFLTLEYSDKALGGLFTATGVGLLMHCVSGVIIAPFFKKAPADDAAVYKYACVYGNCGYMGLPLAQAVFGNEGVFYCSAVIISFQIFTFTHGVRIMEKTNGEKPKIDFKKLLLNPGVIPVFVGLPLFILRAELPNIIMTPVQSIASLNSPLAMLIFGTYIANTNFKSLFKQWRILPVAGYKLIIMPAIMTAIAYFAGLRGTLLCTVVMCSATPPANNTVMFSAKYDRNTSLASQTVAAVSLVSVLSLPAVIAAAQMIA